MGRLAAMERGMAYQGDNELDVLQNQLQATLHSLQAERAKKMKQEDKQDIIDELLKQKGELQEMVRRLKIKQSGGDPDAPEHQQSYGVGQRIRKSFAASRLSRGPSVFDPAT